MTPRSHSWMWFWSQIVCLQFKLNFWVSLIAWNLFQKSECQKKVLPCLRIISLLPAFMISHYCVRCLVWVKFIFFCHFLTSQAHFDFLMWILIQWMSLMLPALMALLWRGWTKQKCQLSKMSGASSSKKFCQKVFLSSMFWWEWELRVLLTPFIPLHFEILVWSLVLRKWEHNAWTFQFS